MVYFMATWKQRAPHEGASRREKSARGGASYMCPLPHDIYDTLSQNFSTKFFYMEK